jgi:hypothetical protein
MGAKNLQIEVLLLTGTTFSSENLCKKDDSSRKNHLTEKEQLGEACWNGLLQTMLPEIYLEPSNLGILYIWQINEAASFLELELAEFPAPIDKQFSIAPHSFLSTQSLN